MPYLSLPSLCSYVRQHGHAIDQWDLNLQFYDQAFDKAYLETQFQARKAWLTPEQDLELQQLLQDLPDLDHIKRVFKTEAFYDYEALLQAKQDLDKVFACFNALYPGSRMTLDHFFMEEGYADSAEVIRASQNQISNPFLDFYTQKVLPELKKDPPDLVGFSIAREYQMIPTFTLARLIREHLPDTHITVGGAYFSKIADGLKVDHHPAFQTLIHSAVKGEGEVPLLKLIESLNGDLPLEEVPSLIYNRPDGRLQVNGIGTALSMNDIEAPDFDGLDLDNYWSAELVLPILGSRDCYWKDCTFCDHFMQFAGFRSRKPYKIADDMALLQQKYGVRHFQFSDETMSPNYGRQLSNALLERELDVHWYTMARLQKGFDRETTDLWRRAGCLFVLTGLESANAELAQKMVKGTDNAITETVYKNLHEAGIFTFAFLIFGFPGETLETATETVQFIRKNQAFINSLATSPFILKKNTPIYRNREAHGVTANADDLKLDWASDIRYTLESGMDNAQAHLFQERFSDEVWLSYRATFWQQLPRIAFFLYLSRFGKDKLLAHNGLTVFENTLEQVRSLKQQGNARAAEFINESVLKRFPFVDRLAVRAAYFALERQQLDKAQHWLNVARQQGHNLAEGDLVAGLWWRTQQAYPQAIQALQSAIHKDIYLTEAYLHLAELYAQQQQLSKAQRMARRALSIHEVDQSFERIPFFTSPDLVLRCERVLTHVSQQTLQVQSQGQAVRLNLHSG